MNSVANTFLSDKTSYVLGYYTPSEDPNVEEEVEAMQLDGFACRKVEEDEGAVDEPLIPKLDEKEKKKK